MPLLLSPFAYSTYRGSLTMGARLGDNQYGKAEIRVMKVDRDRPRHVLHDLTVSVALAGDLDEVHLVGDNSAVLPTDTQKNTVYAFAREHGVDQVEDFAAPARPALRRHPEGGAPARR